ncbi:MAG TPA: hypothetical protein VG370_25720 [Chloroflexota bacterium]|jgi:hypothetical protein|nr:hypothetical protein [Chloroflexota bacterium]
MPAPGDRLAALRARSEDLTGIEFVQVVDKCDQRRLRVYFLTDPRDLRSPFEDLGDPAVTADPLSLEDFRIYNPRGVAPDVEVVPCPGPDAMIWGDDPDAGRRFLEICVAEPGDFAEYRLLIDDERIDRFFNDVQFSFKVGCDDRLDCAEPLTECPPEELVDFPVDYLARDFVSLRNALLDFAAQRYPDWQVPLEADVGVMLLETMAALGDELSYLQDRYNREAYLETATERRSLRHKARLLDYEIHDGRMASTLLELTVRPNMTPRVTSVEGGSPVWARVEGSTPIRFELGTSMGVRGRDTNFPVDELWNPGNFTVYLFDDGQECLETGATELFVRNDPANPDNPGGVLFDAAAVNLWSAGRPLLLRDVPADPSEADRLHVVRVVEVRLQHDDLFDVDVARIRWEARDALPLPIPFEQLQLSGNLVPATAGESRTATFRVGTPRPSDGKDGVLPAVEREGPLFTDVDPSLLSRRNACEEVEQESASRPPIYLLSLPGTEESGLAFADPAEDLRRAEPEVRVYGPAKTTGGPVQWSFRRTLIDESGDDDVFTLEDGTWRRIVGRWLGGAELVHRDYATGAGYTVRFGDGEFGRLPAAGALFEVDYRLGSGVKGNVPAGSVNALAIPAESSPLAARLLAATNPFPVTSGVDPESADEIKLLTPEAYKSETFFAVRPEDYGTQAEKLDFVQRAQGTFRWTGSWLSAVATVDAEDAFELSPERRQLVEALLNCRRQAGRDVIVRDPKFVNLDLVINLCVSRDAFPGQVRVRVLEALFGRGGFQPRVGFFDPDNFTFGTPLRRSALEAAVVSVEGVEAVTTMQVRAHGMTEFKEFEVLAFEVADDELIRVENSALRPERGSLTLELEGGA